MPSRGRIRELPSDLSKVVIYQRDREGYYKRKTDRPYDNSKRKKDGYYYAYWIENGRVVTLYLGGKLDPKLRHLVNAKAKMGRKRYNIDHTINYRGSSDGILEVLDKGEQVVINIPAIAKDCQAYYNKIGDDKYLLYRDPKIKEGTDE